MGGEKFAQGSCGAIPLAATFAAYDRDRRHHFEIAAFAVGNIEPSLDRRYNCLPQIGCCVQFMRMQTLADFARQFAIFRIHAGEVDGRLRSARLDRD